MDLFTYPFMKQREIFALFSMPLWKVIAYFFILNMVMLFPLSLDVITLDNVSMETLGFNIEEDTPPWLPGDLPNCRVESLTLVCEDDTPEIYYMTFNETTYEVHINVDDGIQFDEANLLVFKTSSIEVNLATVSLTLDYRGFEGLDFSTIRTMEKAQGAAIMLDAFFESLRPVIVLPLLIIAVGGIILMNALLIMIFSGLTMMFRYLYTDVPTYGNTLKLFIIASTIPAAVNFLLGWFGLSPFTAIVYNFATPIVALVIYKKNAKRIDENTSKV